MSAFIYTKFILSIAYVIGFYRHIQFYYAQAAHYKINFLLFAENCVYGLMAFVLLWLTFEKKPLYHKVLNAIGVYAFISLAFFPFYVFNSTLSPVEHGGALVSQFLNLLIIARLYIFKAPAARKKLKTRNVRQDGGITKVMYDFEEPEAKILRAPLISSQDELRAHVKDEVFEGRKSTAFGRDVTKIKNIDANKKTKFKRLKKFDLKKV